MNDVKNLLQAALPDALQLPADGPADPAPDLARGRAGLRRRRAGVLSGAAAVLAIAAAVPLAGHSWSGSDRDPQVSASDSPTAASTSMEPIALVAYTGPQPQGYKVAQVPEGWVIQGGDPTSLVMVRKTGSNEDLRTDPESPRGQASQLDRKAAADDPSYFGNKLVVLSGSADATGTPTGTPVTVNGHDGYSATDPGDHSQTLTYQGENGRWVIVSAPADLGWNTAQLVTFASGVTVLPSAEESHG